MKKNFIFIALIFSLQTFATEPEAQLKIVDEPNTDIIYRNSSEFNRINKDYSINYIALGIGPIRAGVVGLNLGFFLDRNSLIDLEYTSGRPLLTSWNYHKYDIQASSYGIHYKFFAGNSFYARGGLDYLVVDYSYTTRDLFTNIESSRTAFKGSSLSAAFLIGNQWQWQNFTLGCDWVGISLPLTSQIDSESFSATSATTVSNLKDEEDFYLKNPISMGLRFYLGATF